NNRCQGNSMVAVYRQRILQAPVEHAPQPPPEIPMKKIVVLVLTPLALLAAAHAATVTDGGVTTSTDPVKAAAVERNAQELAARDTKPVGEPLKAKTKKTAPKTAHKK